MEPLQRQHTQWVPPHYGSEFPYTVVSYNLADSHCCLNASEKTKRQHRLYNHIVESNADIICLQDVGDWNYWRDKFLVKNFTGYWKKRPTTMFGCCIFSRTSRFKLLAREFINDEIMNSSDCEHFIAQIIVLQDKSSNCMKQIVLICNIQTDSDTYNGAIILDQLDAVFRQIKKHIGIHKYPGVLLCGNLNFVPSSSIANFVRSGRLDAEEIDPSSLTGVEEYLSSADCRETFSGNRPPNGDAQTTLCSTPRNRVEILSPLAGEELTFHPDNASETETLTETVSSVQLHYSDNHCPSFLSDKASTCTSLAPYPRILQHQLKPSYYHRLERLRPIYNCDFLHQLPNTNVQLSPRNRDSPVFPLLDNIWYSVGSQSVQSQFHIEERFLPSSPFLVCQLKYLDVSSGPVSPDTRFSFSPQPPQLTKSRVRNRKPLSAKEQKQQSDFRELFRKLLMEAFTADRPSNVKTLDRERAIKQVIQLKDQLELELQNSSEVADLNLGQPLTLSINRFGSTIFGLDSRNSDVDLVIEVQIGGERVLFPRNEFQFSNDFQNLVTGSSEPTARLSKLRDIILKRLAEILEANEDKIQVIQKRLQAFVPLVKASVDYGNEPVTLDLSILTEDKTLLAANCITSVLTWHSAVAPFLFAVKQWAQIMEISDAYTGTINSYGWINMAIWNLRYLYRVPKDPSVPNQRVIPADKTSEALFEDFIWSMSESCFRDYAIAMKVSDGSIVPNQELEPTKYPTLVGHRLWVLLDPVDDKCNIIRTLQVQGVKDIENAIKRTLLILEESPALLYQNKSRLPKSLGELFCQLNR